MPATDFYRALATLKFVRTELLRERDAHNAMKLCFEKIRKSLDMYRGHCASRIRFHLNRHHTEYLRKVRAMRSHRPSAPSPSPTTPTITMQQGTTVTTAAATDEEDDDGAAGGANGSPPNHHHPPRQRRRSMRVGVAQEMAAEIEHLRTIIRRKDLEIERLAMLLDEATPSPAETRPFSAAPDTEGKGDSLPRAARASARERLRMAKRTNPYLPSPSPSSSPPSSPAASDAADRYGPN